MKSKIIFDKAIFCVLPRAVILFSLISAKIAWAGETFFQIRPEIIRRYIDRPLYIDDFKLNLTLLRLVKNHPDQYQSKIQIQFFDDIGMVFHSNNGFLSKAEVRCINDQEQFQCKLDARTLPLHLVDSTCSLTSQKMAALLLVAPIAAIHLEMMPSRPGQEKI